VLRGSFSHFLPIKHSVGEALILEHFRTCYSNMDEIFAQPGLSMAERIMVYWTGWREQHLACGFQGCCVAVKLGAEVSDLSETMRGALAQGTTGLISRLTVAIERGVADGSVSISKPSGQIAESLYSLWLGASVMARIERSDHPFGTALLTTRRMLGILVRNAIAG